MSYEDNESRDSDISHNTATSTAILSENDEETGTKNNFEIAVSQQNKSGDPTAADTETVTDCKEITSHINKKRELCDHQTDKENKKVKYSRSVDNTQSSSSEYDSSVSDSELDMDVSELRDDLILDFVKKIFDDMSRENNETAVAPRPRRLMLDDDKKRKAKRGFNTDKNIVETNEKKVFKTSDKKNVKKAAKNTNYSYKPGPRSKTKDFNYDLQEMILYNRITYTTWSDMPHPPEMTVTCHKLGSFKCRVMITWDTECIAWHLPVKMYELYLSRELLSKRNQLIWTKISKAGSNRLPEKCVLDVERGFTYHFSMRAVDNFDRRSDFSVAQQWI